jgi:hypothetical protein
MAMPKAKTTMLIDAALWEQFRIASIQHHTSASQAVARLMEQQLAQWAKEKSAAPAARKGD